MVIVIEDKDLLANFVQYKYWQKYEEVLLTSSLSTVATNVTKTSPSSTKD